MPGFILHQGAQVQCSHAGTAQPTAVVANVTVGGQPIVVATAQYSVAGCTMPPPAAGNGPCVTATFIPPTAATRVTSNGQPVLLDTSQSVCAPTGTPLLIMNTQKKVTAT
ncbi:MAG TPA: hypothetical protein VKB12_16080 [Pyrinomonadaceae bacterium]|nr:hypothetical protein [Pyrinomonadaceae bacterium]